MEEKDDLSFLDTSFEVTDYVNITGELISLGN
jgi:hypothetical protein